MPEINEQKHPREVSEGLPEQVIDNTSLLYKYPGRKKNHKHVSNAQLRELRHKFNFQV